MRVVRGRRGQPRADRGVTERLLEGAGRGRIGVRVWAPPRQIAFGRRDVREPGYADAKRIASEAGFPSVERDVGGRAVAYTGDTLAFAVSIPRTGGRDGAGIADRYDWATRTVRSALDDLGATVAAGEPPRSFCPGDHSIRVADGGKLSGIAQRVRSDAALVAGCLVVTPSEASAIASVMAPVYDALEVPFDPESVGCVTRAGGPTSPEAVAYGVESALRREVVHSVPGDGGRPVADAEVVWVGPDS